MTIWRKEEDKEKGKTVFHCDEHDFHTSEGSGLESHLKLHNRHLGSFWERKHDAEHGITVYACSNHDFSTRNPLEMEEHERLHAELLGMSFVGW